MTTPDTTLERERWNEALRRSVSVSDKNWWAAAGCSLFGFFGLDRFYAGRPLLGFTKLFTGGGFILWWAADFILLLCGRMKDADGKYIKR